MLTAARSTASRSDRARRNRETILTKFDENYSSRYGHVTRTEAVEIGVRLFMEATARPDSVFGSSQVANPTPSSKRMVYFPRPFERVETEVWDRSSLPVGFKSPPAIIEE
jgi:hypothetical protein